MDDVTKTYDAMVAFVSRATFHSDRSIRILVDVLRVAPSLEPADSGTSSDGTSHGREVSVRVAKYMANAI